MGEAAGPHGEGEVVAGVVGLDEGRDGGGLVGDLGDLGEELEGGVVDLDVVEVGAVGAEVEFHFDAAGGGEGGVMRGW